MVFRDVECDFYPDYCPFVMMLVEFKRHRNVSDLVNFTELIGRHYVAHPIITLFDEFTQEKLDVLMANQSTMCETIESDLL